MSKDLNHEDNTLELNYQVFPGSSISQFSMAGVEMLPLKGARMQRKGGIL